MSNLEPTQPLPPSLPPTPQPPSNQPPPLPPTPVLGQPPTRDRGLLYVVLGGVAIALISLIIGGAGLAFFLFQQRTDSIPEMLAADTQFYAALTPGLDNISDLWRLQDAYDNVLTGDQQNTSAANDALEDLMGVTFEEDIAPWIGPEMGVTVAGLGNLDLANEASDEALQAASDQAQVLLLVQSRNDPRAGEFFDKQREYRESKGQRFTTTIVNDVTIYEQENAEGSPIAAFGLVNHYVVFANKAQAIEELATREVGGANTLQNNPQFTTVLGALPDNRLGYVFVDGTTLGDATRAGLADAIAQSPPEQAAQLEAQAQNAEAFQGLGLAVSTANNGILFDTAMSFDTSKLTAEANAQLTAAAQPIDPERLDRISSEAVAFATFGIPDTFGEQILTAIEAQPDGKNQLRQIEGALNIDLKRDLLGWLAGDVTLAILPGERLGDVTIPATAYFAIQPRDLAAAETGLANIAQAVEEQLGGSVTFEAQDIGSAQWQTIVEPLNQQIVGGYGTVDNNVVIAFGNRAVTAASNGGETPITASENFQSASLEQLQPNGGVIYVDIAQFTELVRDSGFGEALEGRSTDAELRPLRAAIATGQPGLDASGFARSRLFLLVRRDE